MQDEIKKQVEQELSDALDKLNKDYEGICSFHIKKDSILVTNIPDIEIDKFEDAVPFHNIDRCNNSFCTCRYCRVWCPCMGWWRKKQK